MNLKKAVAIVVVFSLVFCSCGEKIPDMVRRDGNTNVGTSDPKSTKEILKERHDFMTFMYSQKDDNVVNDNDNDEDKIFEIEHDKNIELYDKKNGKKRMKSCLLDDECCLENFGLGWDVPCKEVRKTMTTCRKKFNCNKKSNVLICPEFAGIRDFRCSEEEKESTP